VDALPTDKQTQYTDDNISAILQLILLPNL
jgi:hypothetical protein